jgi:hypothetical protein
VEVVPAVVRSAASVEAVVGPVAVAQVAAAAVADRVAVAQVAAAAVVVRVPRVVRVAVVVGPVAHPPRKKDPMPLATPLPPACGG